MVSDIYVDLDDVLAETSRMFISLLFKEFGRVLEYHQLTSFSLSESLGLTSQDLQEFVRLAHTPCALMSIAPVAGAKSVLEKWHESGNHISVVTGRPSACHAVTCEWLTTNGIPYDRVLIADKYARGQEGVPKPISLDEVALMPFALVIEDSLQVATYLAEMNIRVALRTCPWNYQLVDHPMIRRCNSWHDISEALWEATALEN